MNNELVRLRKTIKGLFISESIIALVSIILFLIAAIILVFLGKSFSSSNDINGIGVVFGAIFYTFSEILLFAMIPSSIYMVARFFVSLSFYRKVLKCPTIKNLENLLNINIIFACILGFLIVIGVFFEIILFSFVFNLIYLVVLIVNMVFTIRYCRLSINEMRNISY